MSKDEILKELERRREFTHKTFVVGGLPYRSKHFNDVIKKEIEFLNALIEIVEKSETKYVEA